MSVAVLFSVSGFSSANMDAPTGQCVESGDGLGCFGRRGLATLCPEHYSCDFVVAKRLDL
jgi:hypothetical protein